jgi:hypothetical protein
MVKRKRKRKLRRAVRMKLRVMRVEMKEAVEMKEEMMAAAMVEIAAEGKTKANSQKMRPVTITLKKMYKVNIYTYF